MIFFFENIFRCLTCTKKINNGEKQNPAIRYQNSRPSTVDSGYQQTLIFGGGRFPQTCGQE
jgi:hypothetical protein